MSKHPIPLLPCPWCGSEDVELDWSEELDGNTVVCNQCQACGPGFDQHGPDGNENLEAKAIAAWNKGPYADRHEIHAAALEAHAEELKVRAQEHLDKAAELLKKAEASKP